MSDLVDPATRPQQQPVDQPVAQAPRQLVLQEVEFLWREDNDAVLIIAPEGHLEAVCEPGIHVDRTSVRTPSSPGRLALDSCLAGGWRATRSRCPPWRSG